MTAHTLVSALTLYFEIGLVVALAFVLLVGVIEPQARRAYAFRPLLVPAVTLMWPLMLTVTGRILWQRRRSAP